MEQRQFGDSGLSSSALGFGTWALGTTQYGEIDVQQATAACHMAIDHGVNLIDTAEAYGPLYCEEILGRALGARRQEVTLVTKVGFLVDDAEHKIVGRSSEPAHLLARTEGCLQRLQTDYIDLLLIHWPDHKTPMSDVVGTLETLKAQGKIRYYGVSNYDVAMMSECERYGHLTANQVGYNMLDRRMEGEVLPWLAAHQIGFMAYGSLAFGLLTGALTPETTFVDWDWRSKGKAFGLPLFEREWFLKELRLVERLKGLAADHGRTMAQLAIAWVLSHPQVSVALVGVRTPEELEENVAAADWRLTPADLAAIDAMFAQEGVPTYVDAEQAL
jgi:aryl-alcohol dehydrogenase-like predicted oxidoreductase